MPYAISGGAQGATGPTGAQGPPGPPGAAGGNGSSFLQSGGYISYEGNLNFVVSAAVYQIVGAQYTSAQTALTLAVADASDRIDAFVVNTSGAAAIVKGTAAATPSLPSIDPATQLLIGFVTIPAGATTIAAATNTLLYDENAGTPTEWATATLSGTWDFANTTNPLNGTKDIYGAAIASGQGFKLTGAAPIDLSAYVNGVLVLPIRVVSAWGQNRGVSAVWFNGNVQKGYPVNVQDGVYGFSRSLTSAYQYAVIPLTNFGIPPGTTVDTLHVFGYGGTIALRVDWVRLQGAAVTQTVAGLTQAQADARYVQQTSQSLLADISFAFGDKQLAVAPQVNEYADVFVDFACTIQQWTLGADAGTCTVDIYACSQANYDGGSTHPVSGDKITASAPPAIASGNKGQSSSLGTWTTAVNAGTWFRFIVTAVSGMNQVSGSLKVLKSA